MAENSKIEWTDHTWNPWVGCTKVSPACDHCYAESWAKRTGSPELWNGSRRRTSVANWMKPHKWQNGAAAFHAEHGRKQRVFCASLADIFDNKANPAWRDDLWDVIQDTPDLIWMLLTKRPQNLEKMLPGGELWREIKHRIWLGTTVENQEEADRRIPHLLKHDSAVRFLSCEPLLGPVNLKSVGGQVPEYGTAKAHGTDVLTPYNLSIRPHQIDWVICGGESGKQARPMHPDWARGLRDQCATAGVPFFFKQWGEWAPGDAFGLMQDGPITDRHGSVRDWMRRYVVCEDRADRVTAHSFTEHAVDLVYRVGKARAGHLLDGREHFEWPAQV